MKKEPLLCGMDPMLKCPSDGCPYRRSICPTPFEHMSVKEIRKYSEINRDCSTLHPLERTQRVIKTRESPSKTSPEGGHRVTEAGGNNESNHKPRTMLATKTKRRMDQTQPQQAERRRTHSFEGACPDRDVELMSLEAKGQGKKIECNITGRSEQAPISIAKILASFGLELNEMKSDQYIMLGLITTWEKHLSLNLEE